MNDWPDAGSYAQAAREPATFFTDDRLRAATLRKSPLGIPLPATGRNALVFKATVDAKPVALRCFTNPPSDGSLRYHHLHDHLAARDLEFMPDVAWIDDGVTVAERDWPLIEMDWVEGLGLDRWVAAHLDEPNTLQSLADRWVRLLENLDDADIAHGDLQHGNVLIDDDGQVYLVDFDGIWLPSMAQMPPTEFGHRNYQHPGRVDARSWHRRIDGFSALVIDVSLRALSHRPELWERFNDSANNLILTEGDFRDLDSEVWTALWAIDDDRLHRSTEQLRHACTVPVDDLAGPLELLSGSGIVRTTSPGWLLNALDGAPPPTPPAAETGAPMRSPRLSRAGQIAAASSVVVLLLLLALVTLT